MNIIKLALLSFMSVSTASVSSAASLATKVDPAVLVPGENSSSKWIRVKTSCKDSRNFDILDGIGGTVKCYILIKA
jgi:hypothetical protein